MGRIKNGILGGFSGKVGSVVGASWLGIDYMRALPKKSTKPATDFQLAQRNKMAMLRGFLLGVEDIIEQCIQNITKYKKMNEALSYNMLNAIEGVYPDQKINFKNLLFSRGELRGAWSAKAISVEPHSIDFSWENGIAMPLCATDDQVTVVVYNPEKLQFCKLQNAGLREDKITRLILPENFTGDTVHCYISFYSDDRKLASTGEYLGTTMVL